MEGVAIRRRPLLVGEVERELPAVLVRQRKGALRRRLAGHRPDESRGSVGSVRRPAPRSSQIVSPSCPTYPGDRRPRVVGLEHSPQEVDRLIERVQGGRRVVFRPQAVDDLLARRCEPRLGQEQAEQREDLAADVRALDRRATPTEMRTRPRSSTKTRLAQAGEPGRARVAAPISAIAALDIAQALNVISFADRSRSSARPVADRSAHRLSSVRADGPPSPGSPLGLRRDDVERAASSRSAMRSSTASASMLRTTGSSRADLTTLRDGS